MKKIAICISLIVLIFFNCQSNIDWNNPLDPASPSYKNKNEQVVMVNNFDQGPEGVNFWGWDTELWSESFNSYGGAINFHFSNKVRKGNYGYSYEIIYSTLNHPDEVVGWIHFIGDKVNPLRGLFNASTLGLNKLTFWIRGDTGGEVCFVSIADGDDIETAEGVNISTVLLEKKITTTWQKASFELSKLALGDSINVNLTQLQAFMIEFSAHYGPRQGKVYIDDVAFEH